MEPASGNWEKLSGAARQAVTDKWYAECKKAGAAIDSTAWTRTPAEWAATKDVVRDAFVSAEINVLGALARIALQDDEAHCNDHRMSNAARTIVELRAKAGSLDWADFFQADAIENDRGRLSDKKTL